MMMGRSKFRSLALPALLAGSMGVGMPALGQSGETVSRAVVQPLPPAAFELLTEKYAPPECGADGEKAPTLAAPRLPPKGSRRPLSYDKAAVSPTISRRFHVHGITTR